MRSTSPDSLVSSTSTKAVVCGVSVGGEVSQTRGVTFRAPNSTVWLMGISRCEMRPVTLSRAANTAIGFLMASARAGAEASAQRAATEKTKTPAAALRRETVSPRCIIGTPCNGHDFASPGALLPSGLTRIAKFPFAPDHAQLDSRRPSLGHGCGGSRSQSARSARKRNLTWSAVHTPFSSQSEGLSSSITSPKTSLRSGSAN